MLGTLSIRSEFGRNVAALMTGTTLAQALPILASPVLSRLYAPDDFGVLGIYVAICAIMSVLAAGRYEMAIVQPRTDEEAISIAALAALITLCTGIVLWLALAGLSSRITTLTRHPELEPWLYLLPASIMLTSYYQILNYWNNRQKRFRQLAASRAVQSAGAVGTQCAMGYQQASATGLISGFFTGQLCALLWLVHANIRTLRNARHLISWQSMRQSGARYLKYPLFSTWGALLDTAALQLPLLAIVHVFGYTTTGLFSFAFRVMTVPLNLIAGSIAQVLFQRVAQLHNDNAQGLRAYLLRIFAVLAGLSALPVALFTLFGAPVFTFVFGEAWTQAGHYAGILIVAAAARFCVYPLSVVLSLERHVKKGVAWQLCYFITLSSVMFGFSHSGVDLFLKAFAVHEVVLYGIYLAIILHATGQTDKPPSEPATQDSDRNVPLPAVRKP